MRFAAAHKAATYLLVGCAYVAMIAGGGVSPLIALAGSVGLVGSWWWEPPLVKFERWSWVWTVASLFALVYSVLTAIVTGDFLGVGAQFLVWLVVAKSYNRRAARDWQQIYLLSFLMLVAGSVLDPDLTYGLCFLGYVIAATWALTLFHLRREMEDNLLVKHAADRASERVEVRRILDSKRIVGGRFFVGTGALSLGVFLISAVVFLALPRVGFGFFLKNKSSLVMRGFADTVKLGGHGVLKDDPTVVMRVEIASAIGSRNAPEIHWRGVAFDQYRGGTWRVSREAPNTLDIVDSPRAGVERHTLSWIWARPSDGDALEHEGTRQDIWLEPLDSDVMFGASIPRVFERAGQLRRSPRTTMQNEELRLEHSGTVHYTVWSQLVPPRPDVLRRAAGALPPGYQVYLQVPTDQLSQRTIALAHQIADGQPTAYDKAIAIKDWLDANLSYTLELVEPHRGQEPLDFFLFDRKKGHCEYFASAFAILARIVGIPTREVDGFLGGEWNEYQGYVAVRAGDAHAWDEVFFPGAGWVTFDPTPPDRNDPLGRGGDGVLARVSRMLDTLRFQWTKWVIEYDLVAQLSLFKDLASTLKRGAIALRDALVGLVRFWPALPALGAAIIAIVLWRRRRSLALAPNAAGAPRGRTSIGRVYDAVSRRLAKAGFARAPAQTPRELAARVPATIAEPVRELTELYYSAEWGGKSDPNAERRAAELADAIRSALDQPATA
jgi:transglutaminase-like putative cysteine protease